MPERDTRLAAPPAECRIAEVVTTHKQRVIAERFFQGDAPIKIARSFGLSRTGVEHLIRLQSRLRRASR